MPPATEILDALSAIANQASGIAVTWHIVIAMALVALAAGWRPSQRTARLLMGMPLASVAGVAIVLNKSVQWVGLRRERAGADCDSGGRRPTSL